MAKFFFDNEKSLLLEFMDLNGTKLNEWNGNIFKGVLCTLRRVIIENDKLPWIMHKEHQLKALISLHSTHLVIIKVCFNDFFLEYGL